MLAIASAQNDQAQPQAASARLLRNFGEVAPAGTPYAGLPIASGTWWGLTGAEIAASAAVGEHGAGLLANDNLSPDADYRLVVRNSSFAGDALVVQEDGAVEYLGPGTAVYDLYEANLLLPGGPAAISAGFAPPQYAGLLGGMLAARAMPAVAAAYTGPATAGALPAMQAARSMPAVVASYAAPGASGSLPAMQVARTMPAVAASYAPPSFAGSLAAMLVASSMPALAAAYAAPGASGSLPAMQVARTMPALAASYAAPTYSGALGAMQVASTMPAVAGLFSLAAWDGVLPAMQAPRTMPAIAGVYTGPAYAGALQPQVRTVTMLGLAATYTAPGALPQAAGGYATQDDMRVRFGQVELVQLTDRAATAEQVDTDVMSRALLDADAEINMRLHSRYALPLQNVPRVLVNIACDIARWRLMEDRATDQVTRRYEEALKLLDKIGQGKLALGLQADESRLKATGGPTVVGGGKRIFSRGRLADYSGDA